MQTILQETIATIVRRHHTTAPVFEKYHLDYCCKGKRPLGEACVESGVDIQSLLNDLEQAVVVPDTPETSYTDATKLIGHILLKHHFYIRQHAPVILQHLLKIATKHGEKYPHMPQVYLLFAEAVEALVDHMNKEELILFPRIQQLYHRQGSQQFESDFIAAPVQELETEHQTLASKLDTIRQLTNNYTPPADACTTHTITIAELSDFEADFHKHLHLENNILFPMAQHMMKGQMMVAF